MVAQWGIADGRSHLQAACLTLSLCMRQTCNGGEYVSVAGTGSSDLACSACTICPHGTHYESAACVTGAGTSLGADRVCAAYTVHAAMRVLPEASAVCLFSLHFSCVM